MKWVYIACSQRNPLLYGLPYIYASVEAACYNINLELVRTTNDCCELDNSTTPNCPYSRVPADTRSLSWNRNASISVVFAVVEMA